MHLFDVIYDQSLALVMNSIDDVCCCKSWTNFASDNLITIFTSFDVRALQIRVWSSARFALADSVPLSLFWLQLKLELLLIVASLSD